MSILTQPGRRGKWLFLGLVGVLAVTLQVLGVNPALAQNSALTAHSADSGDKLLDPWANDWAVADDVDIALTAQQITYPNGGGFVPTARVRALQSDGVLYMRIRWTDDTPDTKGSRVDEYTDAVAVEFPSVAGSSVPAICMGQADGGVNIWQWRATNHAGLGNSAKDLFPDAQVDLYPSTDDLYFSARYVGNPVARSGRGSTENLVAQGFGTLADARTGSVQGRGSWSDKAWTVVVARDLNADGKGQIGFQNGTPIDTAFAIWDGSHKDRNGKKSVSGFVRLTLDNEVVKFNPGVPVTTLVIFSVAALALGALAVGFITHMLDKRSAMAHSGEITKTDLGSPKGEP